jgi:hypothetical protein
MGMLIVPTPCSYPSVTKNANPLCYRCTLYHNLCHRTWNRKITMVSRIRNICLQKRTRNWGGGEKAVASGVGSCMVATISSFGTIRLSLRNLIRPPLFTLVPLEFWQAQTPLMSGIFPYSLSYGEERHRLEKSRVCYLAVAWVRMWWEYFGISRFLHGSEYAKGGWVMRCESLIQLLFSYCIQIKSGNTQSNFF